MIVSAVKEIWLKKKIDACEKRDRKAKKDKPRIALGFSWRAPNIGGVRRHLESIQRYSSFPVTLYPSNCASEMLVEKAQRKKYLGFKVEEILGSHSLIHTHVDPGFINLAQHAKQQGMPWVHTYHLMYFPEDWGGELMPWQQEINRCLVEEASKADRCLAVGSWLVDYLKREYGISSEFVPNGVSMDVADRADANRFEAEYGLKDFVLFVNSIAGVKNPIEFITAAKAMPEKTFVMIGTGLSKENVEAVLDIDVPENLILLGPLPHEITLDAIAACSVFVMTSHREGLPTVLLEAMILERSCVVPDAPWFSDAVQCKDHGLMYQLGDIPDLVEKINSAGIRGRVPAARTHVENTFSWPVVLRQLDEIYANLINNPVARSS